MNKTADDFLNLQRIGLCYKLDSVDYFVRSYFTYLLLLDWESVLYTAVQYIIHKSIFIPAHIDCRDLHYYVAMSRELSGTML